MRLTITSSLSLYTLSIGIAFLQLNYLTPNNIGSVLAYSIWRANLFIVGCSTLLDSNLSAFTAIKDSELHRHYAYL